MPDGVEIELMKRAFLAPAPGQGDEPDCQRCRSPSARRSRAVGGCTAAVSDHTYLVKPGQDVSAVGEEWPALSPGQAGGG